MDCCHPPTLDSSWSPTTHSLNVPSVERSDKEISVKESQESHEVQGMKSDVFPGIGERPGSLQAAAARLKTADASYKAASFSPAMKPKQKFTRRCSQKLCWTPTVVKSKSTWFNRTEIPSNLKTTGSKSSILNWLSWTMRINEFHGVIAPLRWTSQSLREEAERDAGEHSNSREAEVFVCIFHSKLRHRSQWWFSQDFPHKYIIFFSTLSTFQKGVTDGEFEAI